MRVGCASSVYDEVLSGLSRVRVLGMASVAATGRASVLAVRQLRDIQRAVGLGASVTGRRLIAGEGNCALYEYGTRPREYVGRPVDQYNDYANRCKVFACAGFVLARIPNEAFLSARVELTILWHEVRYRHTGECMACKGRGGRWLEPVRMEGVRPLVDHNGWFPCRYCHGTGRNQQAGVPGLEWVNEQRVKHGLRPLLETDE